MTFHNGVAAVATEGTWRNDILLGAESVLPINRTCIICTENADAAIIHGDTVHNVCCMACANTLVQDGSTVSNDQLLRTCVVLLFGSIIFSHL